jgi:hypothetical protein
VPSAAAAAVFAVVAASGFKVPLLLLAHRPLHLDFDGSDTTIE